RPPRSTGSPGSVREAIDRPRARSAYTALVHDEPPAEAPALSSIPIVAPPPPEPLAEMRNMGELDATLDDAGSDRAAEEAGEPVEGLEQAGEEMVETLDESTGGGGEGDEVEEGDGEGREAGGGSRGTRSRRASQGDAATGDLVRTRAPPLPRTGRAILPRMAPRIAVRVQPYGAVADLPRPAPVKQEEGGDAGSGAAAAERARGSYAAAVKVGKSFYDQLVGAARDIGAATEREARQAHEQLDADLALALQVLEITLSKRLGTNDQERDRAMAMLQSLA